MGRGYQYQPAFWRGPAGLGTTRGDLPADIRLEPIVLAAMILMLWAAA